MDGDFTARAPIELNWVRPRFAVPAAPGLSQRPGSASLFRRDFSDDALLKPVEPVFSRTDLLSERQAGFDAGYAAGLAAAATSDAASRTASETQALTLIATTMAQGCQQTVRVADRAAAALAKALIGSMRAVMPELIERSGLNEVGAMLDRVLPGLSREPAVRIDVPVALADYVAGTVSRLAAEQRGTITVTGIDTMTPGEVRIGWGAGHAKRQPDQVWQAVMDALQAALTDSKDPAHGE